MKKVVKELIEYNGVDSYLSENMKNFKQFNINDELCVPIEKPDIEQLTKVWVNYEILNYKLIETPSGTSCEGQILTGHKAFISGNLNLKFEYVSEQCNQTIHSMYDTIAFCVYVAIDEDVNDCTSICPSISIEDIYCEQLGPRKIYVNITLMALVDVC